LRRNLKGFQIQGASHPDSMTRSSSHGPRWGLCPELPL